MGYVEDMAIESGDLMFTRDSLTEWSRLERILWDMTVKLLKERAIANNRAEINEDDVRTCLSLVLEPFAEKI